MIAHMSIRQTDAKTIRGKAWAAKYPHAADDIYVVAQVGGKKKRIRIGPNTPENHERAARKVAEYRAILERQQLRAAGMVTLGFAEAADLWLRQGLRRRAPKTIRTRTFQAGRLKGYFGNKRLDTIDTDAIAAWWDAEVEGKMTTRTGRTYLDALSMIFRHAAKSEPVPNPVPDARARIFAEIEHTAESRAANQQNLRPLSSDELAKLLPHLTGDLQVTVLLMYEAGLRIGEALGIQWGDLWYGRDADDTSRHIHVQRSRKDGEVGLTKSGRSRRVAMSRRLRSLLLERHMASGRPAETEWVVSQWWTANVRHRLDRACKRAGIGRRVPKDFRDTYASTLITHGIVLKWISLQLGHASVAVTERHYAGYMAADSYQNPWMVPAGCLPPDLFVEMDGWGRGHKRAHTGTTTEKPE